MLKGLILWAAPRLIALGDRRPPDFVIAPGGPDEPYLKRWWLIPRNRFFNIYLHHILVSDDTRALHDHPWANLSVLLAGSYDEVTPRWRFAPTGPFVRTRRSAGDLKLRLATAAHRLEITGHPCWTLFVTGPKIRTWGFWCRKGFVPWTEYTETVEGGSVIGAGCGES